MVFDADCGPKPRRPNAAAAPDFREPPRPACACAPHLVDTTMFFAPRSGGVKRYLLAKADWLRRNRPALRHTLVIPGGETRCNGAGVMTIAAARLPFAGGYRWPTSHRLWSDHLVRLRPSLIEAGDPYAPGHAALEAGERLGAPVIGFCHSDPAALAAFHLGEWAEPAVRRRWLRLLRRFDRVVAPSRHIAERLVCEGISQVMVQPLGVDTDLFHPCKADPEGVRRQLGLPGRTRLLVFAGRPAREKNVEVLLEASSKLGPNFHLLLVGAGGFAKPQRNATFLNYQSNPEIVARLLASADALVHANDREPFGLVVLEAMASGLPVVGVASGGIGEIVDDQIGQLASRAHPAAMAEAIDALFNRDLAAIGATARRRAVSLHSWDATFEGLWRLYAELAGETLRGTQRMGVQLRPDLVGAAS